MRRLRLMTKKLTKQDINKMYVRNLFGFQWGWNYEKMQGLGYAYSIMPVLKRLYSDDKEKMSIALKTHLGFFNTTPAMSSLIVGADAGLEEEFGMADPEAITGLKTGLMGPFAGVGDTVFIAIYRAIVFSISAYMAQAGQVLGLLIPLIMGTVVMWIRYKFIYIGYAQGKKIATEFADKMKLFTEAAAILGLTVVGGLIPSVITYKLDLTYKMGEVSLSVQEMLDKILPGLVPLGIVFLSYWLLGKKKMNSTRLIFVLILLGMVLGNLQAILTWISQFI
ncbi:PTS system mannose/fructose/sorbose family transporter subunit IID [Enterococcus faecium]|nr:PTS system mannose/fructose/sorbose family transporter subunit IID [Enterococcus faecium]EKO5892560.1 PTS system mannose/fructose/sorbose family transporter subunit IID [Enterococcus faecium]ELI7154145.1 PTS system mannose/fructose/sorbose family transporter subunit IID [Enterococcus faecium]ELY8215279.1 PTS system mannose/fructose/sorbose family transporter subunit IID [Enterococcus faecium]HCC6681700.1 PTS system mannose/fructose/sorbose family transporter subunit IID [Enterococcus faecium